MNGESSSLLTTVFSDLTRAFPLEFKDTEKIENCDLQTTIEEKVEIKPINYKALLNKKRMIDKCIYNKEPKNIFCNRDKSKCKSCFSKCLYSLDEVDFLKKATLLKELSAHRHPKTRLINNKQRNVKEGREELKEHYKTIHFLKKKL